MKTFEGRRKSKGNNTHHKEDVVVGLKTTTGEISISAAGKTQINAEPATQPSPGDNIPADSIQESAFVDVSTILNTSRSALDKGAQKPGSNIQKNGGWLEV
jgi:hypothetical protein